MLTLHRILEHNFWENQLKVYDKIDLPIGTRISSNAKSCNCNSPGDSF